VQKAAMFHVLAPILTPRWSSYIGFCIDWSSTSNREFFFLRLVPVCPRRYTSDSNLDYFEFAVAEIIAAITGSLTPAFFSVFQCHRLFHNMH
jgi:hypothetical protein